jgi:hypothetical protein
MRNANKQCLGMAKASVGWGTSQDLTHHGEKGKSEYNQVDNPLKHIVRPSQC